MADTAYLLYTSRLFGKDPRSKKLKEQWYVPAGAGQAIDFPGVPALLSAHTDDPALLVDSKYESARINNEATIVEVLYSNDRSFQGPPRLNDRDPYYRQWGVTFSQGERKVPTFVKRRVKYNSNGALATKDVWERQNMTIPTKYIVATRRLNESTLPPTSLTLIAAQLNKIHYFFGLNWKFQGGSIYEAENARFDVTYQWFHEPGNGPIPVERADPATQALMGTNMILPPARGAFFEYVILPSTSQGDAPLVIAVPTLDYEDDGARTLPGDPLS